MTSSAISEIFRIATLPCLGRDITIAIGEIDNLSLEDDQLHHRRGPWAFHRVESVNGIRQPSPWLLNPYEPFPAVHILAYPEADAVTGLCCPRCRRLVRLLLVDRPARCRDCQPEDDQDEGPPDNAPLLFEDQGTQILLARTPTCIFPDLLHPQLVMGNPLFPPELDNCAHPRWLLAVHLFLRFVWETTGLDRDDPEWPMVEAIYAPIYHAWERQDWDGFQQAIAAAKAKIVTLPCKAASRSRWTRQPQRGEIL